jgi:hypothetical protein
MRETPVARFILVRGIPHLSIARPMRPADMAHPAISPMPGKGGRVAIVEEEERWFNWRYAGPNLSNAVLHEPEAA